MLVKGVLNKHVGSLISACWCQLCKYIFNIFGHIYIRWEDAVLLVCGFPLSTWDGHKIYLYLYDGVFLMNKGAVSRRSHLHFSTIKDISFIWIWYTNGHLHRAQWTKMLMLIANDSYVFIIFRFSWIFHLYFSNITTWRFCMICSRGQSQWKFAHGAMTHKCVSVSDGKGQSRP